MKLTIERKRQLAWITLFAVALIGIILMFIDCYGRPLSEINRGSDLVKYPNDKHWHEYLIFPFYFTFQSNMLAVIVPIIVFFELIKKKKVLRRLQIFMAVNLLITMLVYWATLFPIHHPDNGISWTTNLLVHLIVPLLAIVAFFVQTLKNKETHAYSNIWKAASWNLLYPVVWLIIGLVIYFSLGMVHSAAIYHFMNIAHNPWYETIGYIIGVFGAYYLFTVLAIWLSNPKRK